MEAGEWQAGVQVQKTEYTNSEAGEALNPKRTNSLQKSRSAVKSLRFPGEVLKSAPQPHPKTWTQLVLEGADFLFLTSISDQGEAGGLGIAWTRGPTSGSSPPRQRGALSLIIAEGPVASLEGVTGDLEVGMESQLVAKTISLVGALTSRG